MAKIKTAEQQKYGMVAVPGYTGARVLVPGATKDSPGRYARLGKVVGDPATLELARAIAPSLIQATR